MSNSALRKGSEVWFNVGQGRMKGKIVRLRDGTADIAYVAPNGFKMIATRKLEIVRRVK